MALFRLSQRNHGLYHRVTIHYQSRMSLPSRILCQHRRTGSKPMLAAIDKSNFHFTETKLTMPYLRALANYVVVWHSSHNIGSCSLPFAIGYLHSLQIDQGVR